MSKLYTSLVRVKESLNGGSLPAMTEIPEEAKRVIDPRFTIGMGALTEDEDKGLRCPVRGCGEWYHGLTRHLNAAHADIGGAEGVKNALSIPQTAKLSSRSLREKLSSPPAKKNNSPPADHMAPRWLRGEQDTIGDFKKKVVGRRMESARKRAGVARSRAAQTVGTLNLRNSCEAQIVQRIMLVYDKIGRMPVTREARHFDPPLVDAARRAYGTWSAARAAAAEKAFPSKESSRVAVVEAVKAWHDEHGRFPRWVEADRPHDPPLIPRSKTILRVMQKETWGEAMKLVASIAGIRGGRYGLPEKEQAKEAA